MSVVNYFSRIQHIIISDLCAATDDGLFSAVSNTSDCASACMTARKLVFNAVAKCNICHSHGSYFVFTGEVYEVVNPEVISKAVEDWLIRSGVSNKLMYYSGKKFQDEALLSIRLNNPFKPVFSIKAYENGVVDFSKGELHPFSPRFHVTYKNPYEYNPRATCPMWQSFLRTVLPEKESRLILQMFLGLCTYDRNSMVDKVEHCLMLYGSGSNGKSVIYETITGIFGKENISTMGLMSLIKGGDERLRNIAKIDGKVVNVCPEIQARDISGYEDAFKTLCSGEMVYGRLIGKDVYEVRNIPRLIFNMNQIPTASDSSYGYFRRFLYVIFERIIPEEMQNKHLADDLRTEYPGILNWIIRGAKYLKQRKFVFPKSENSEKQKLIAMAYSNIVMSWAMARGVRHTPTAKGEIHTWIRAKAMYDDCVQYALMNGFNESAGITIRDFGRLMNRIGFGMGAKKRVSEGMMYKVYGCTELDLKKAPPIVNDMELDLDEFNDVELDKEDII